MKQIELMMGVKIQSFDDGSTFLVNEDKDAVILYHKEYNNEKNAM